MNAAHDPQVVLDLARHLKLISEAEEARLLQRFVEAQQAGVAFDLAQELGPAVWQRVSEALEAHSSQPTVPRSHTRAAPSRIPPARRPRSTPTPPSAPPTKPSERSAPITPSRARGASSESGSGRHVRSTPGAEATVPPRKRVNRPSGRRTEVRDSGEHDGPRRGSPRTTEQTAPGTLPARRRPSERTAADAPTAQADSAVVPPTVAYPATARPAGDTEFGRYRVVEELGQGAIGRVLLVHDPRLRRDLAIKQLLDANDDKARSYFIEEAQITGQLQHPNIVPVFDLGFDENEIPYLAMKRIEGRPLDTVIREAHREASKKGTWHWAQRRLLDVFRKVCEAIAYAHEQGVVHRDLKPANIMVGDYGEVFVVDWGLARSPRGADVVEAAASASRSGSGDSHHVPQILTDRRASGEHTMVGDVFGTPAYMPPEQARNAAAVDQRADIYALGATLYHILTGHPPFDPNLSGREVLRAVRRHSFPPPSEHPKATQPVAAELEQVVLKAMSYRPSERYNTAAALKADVDAYVDGGYVAAARYSPWQRMRKWVARNRTLSAVSATAVVLLVLGVAVALHLREQALIDEREQQAAARAAALEEFLDEQRDAVAAWTEELRALDEVAEAGDWEEAIAKAEAFVPQRAEAFAEVERSERVHEHAPALLEALEALEAEAASARERYVRGFAETWREYTETSPEAATSGEVAAVEEGFARLREYVAEEALADLPLAELAAWRVEVALATGDEAAANRWVAEAYRYQPQARHAGEAMLALAEHDVAEQRYSQAATRYYLAREAFGDAFAALRVRASLGLARTLSQLGPEAGAPFAPAIPARKGALHVLLELVDKDGHLRSDVAAALDDDDKRAAFERNAGDLLFALRRITLGATVPGDHSQLTTIGGEPYILGRSESDGDIKRWRVRLPEGPSLDAPRVEPVEPVNFLDTLQEAAPELRHHRWRFRHAVELTADLGREAYVVTFQNRADQHYATLVVDGIRERHNVLHAEIHPRPARGNSTPPRGPQSIAVADLDGNGRADIVLGYEAWEIGAYVLFQGADGSFESFGPFNRDLHRDNDENTARYGDVRSATIADVTGDNRPEIVLSDGVGRDGRLKVYRVNSARNIERIAAEEIGESRRIVPVPRIDGPGVDLAVSQHMGSYGYARMFPILGLDLPPRGVFVYRYTTGGRGTRLKPVFREGGPYNPATLIGANVSRRLAGTLVKAPGRAALVETHHIRDRVMDQRSGFLRWHLFARRGDWESDYRYVDVHGESLDSYQVPTDGLRHLVAYGDEERHRITRELSDADLALLREQELAWPAEPAWQGHSQRVSLVRFLFEFGLAEEAAELAEEMLPEVERSEARHELQLVRLLGLLQAQRFDELEALLDEVEPGDSLAQAYATTVEAVAEHTHDYAAAARYLDRASHSATASRDTRRELARRAEVWRNTAAELRENVVTWRGDTLRTSGDDAQLEEYLLTNMINLVAPTAERETGKRACNPTQTLDGSTRPFTAVPVAYLGGSLRVTLDYELEEAPFNSRLRMGPMPLEYLIDERADPDPFAHTVSVSGFNRDFSVAFNDRRLDALVGRRLRTDIEYLAPTRRLRIRHADPETETVLVVHDTVLDEPPAPGVYGFGFVGRNRGVSPLVHVERICIGGQVELVPRNAAQLRGYLAERPLLEVLGEAEAAHLRGDTAESASALRRAVEKLREQQGDSRAVELVELEADWREHGREGFLARLDESTSDGTLRRWARLRPQQHGDETWEAVGEALAQRRDATAPELLAQIMDGEFDNAETVFALTAYLCEFDAGALAHDQRIVASLFHIAFARAPCVMRAQQHAQPPIENQGFAELFLSYRIKAKVRALRRAEAYALLREYPRVRDELESPRDSITGELIETLHEATTRHLEEQQQRAAEQGVPSPRWQEPR